MTNTSAVTEAVKTIMDELNGGSRKAVADAILDAVARTHRTLQQNFWDAMLQAQTGYAAHTFDARNEAAVKLANAVKDMAREKNWDLGLPRL
jgi:flavin-binding protein dodecin